MTSRDFCFWLQGFLEIGAAADVHDPAKVGLTPAQVESIQRHLALVFKHEIDPSMGPKKVQDELNKLHAARPPGRDDLVLRC